jgi:transcriptional regulator with XRE-family HTH domain
MSSLDVPDLRATFGAACRDVRRSLDVSLRDVADLVRISPSYLARIERGIANPTVETMLEVATALGMTLAPTILGRPPVAERGDRVHARCSGYVARRLRRAGWQVLREVPVIDGRYRGWIDLLAFDPGSGTLLIVEIKTRLHDLGAIERQTGWYEQHAVRIARDRGWFVGSDENERVITRDREIFDDAFPVRSAHLDATLPTPARGLAMIDPSSRRAEWLLRPMADGRRTRSPYRDYADAAARLGVGR